MTHFFTRGWMQKMQSAGWIYSLYEPYRTGHFNKANLNYGLLKKSLVHQLRGGKAKLYMNTAS